LPEAEQHIRHDHQQGRALRRLLRQAEHNAEQRDRKHAAADPEQPAEHAGSRTERDRPQDLQCRNHLDRI
jgi:hypothetical protein